MKDLSQALVDELATIGVSKSQIDELILDGKCRATDLSCLEGMGSLTALSLCNVGLVEVTGFPFLPSLTSLVLADNRVGNGLGTLAEALPNLKVLSLAHNRISELTELEPLRALPLTQLDLCECPLVKNTENYRNRVLEMFPALEILDNLDREGIELIDESDLESEEDGGNEDGDEDSEMEDEAEGEPEMLNLLSDADDDQTEESEEEDEEPEEIHVSVLAGPPIPDEKSEEDQDYVVSDDESESEAASYESDEEVSVSHHFAAGSSSAQPAQPSSSAALQPGNKRKRKVHGKEDLERNIPRDEDYEDI